MTYYHLPIQDNPIEIINQELAQYYVVSPFYYATKDEQSCNIGFVISTAPEEHHHFYMQIWDYSYVDAGQSNILPNENNLITNIYKGGLYLFTDIKNIPKFIQREMQRFLVKEDEERGIPPNEENLILDTLVSNYFVGIYDNYQSEKFLAIDGNKKHIQHYYHLQDTLRKGNTTKQMKI